jgi:hypothetical protein
MVTRPSRSLGGCFFSGRFLGCGLFSFGLPRVILFDLFLQLRDMRFDLSPLR